jgi:ribosome maturation factor RimP
MSKPVNVEWLQQRVRDLEAEVEQLQSVARKAKSVLTYIFNHKNTAMGKNAMAIEAIVVVSEQIEAAFAKWVTEVEK